jgi:hypothetical protein
MIIKTIISLWYILTHGSVGIATIFSSNDAWNPNAQLACFSRDINDEVDVVVAHPTLPCRSKVWLYNLRTKRSAVAIVADRGPRRAMIDTSPLLARMLRLNGLEHVLMVPLGR